MASRMKPIAAAVASAMVIGLAAAPSAIGQTTGNSETSSAQQGKDRATSTSSQYGNQTTTSATQDTNRAGTQNVQSGTRAATQQGNQQAMVDMRASRLMGRDVRNAQGSNELGEITDLVVDMNANRIHYAILSRGGVVGIGDKQYAVPVSRFNLTRDGRLTLNMSEQQIKDAPDIDKARADWNDPRLWSNVGQYYHRTLGMPATQANTSQRFHRASDVIGMEVLSANNDHVGEVEDLVVNLQNGSIHYAVLEFDRAWNPNDKLVALPLSSLRPSENNLVINMSREQIAAAPSFERRNWPSLADTGFRNRVAGPGANRSTIGMDPATPMTALIVVIDEPEYTRLDANRDGRLSRAEVRTIGELDRQWSQADRDSDGFLTRDELRQFGNRSQTSSAAGISRTSGGSTPSTGASTTASGTSPAASPSR